MARNRTISPDFWTWEAIIDCAPMTRLLFIGLWNFADDFGVQPLCPRTIRMRIFPGDAVDGEAVGTMIGELAARGLVQVYSVEGQDYVAIADWGQLRRVGKRARRRFPAAETMANHSNPSPRTVEDEGLPHPTPATETMANHSNPPPASREEAWRAAIGERPRQAWPNGQSIDAMDAAATAHWIEGDCDLEHDALTAVSGQRMPPAGLHEPAVAVEVNCVQRLAAPAGPPMAAA